MYTSNILIRIWSYNIFFLLLQKDEIDLLSRFIIISYNLCSCDARSYIIVPGETFQREILSRQNFAVGAS